MTHKVCVLFVPLVLISLLCGCGQQSGPEATTQKASAAKEQLIEMNKAHQKRLEELILPGQGE